MVCPVRRDEVRLDALRLGLLRHTPRRLRQPLAQLRIQQRDRPRVLIRRQQSRAKVLGIRRGRERHKRHVETRTGPSNPHQRRVDPVTRRARHEPNGKALRFDPERLPFMRAQEK